MALGALFLDVVTFGNPTLDLSRTALLFNLAVSAIFDTILDLGSLRLCFYPSPFAERSPVTRSTPMIPLLARLPILRSVYSAGLPPVLSGGVCS